MIATKSQIIETIKYFMSQNDKRLKDLALKMNNQLENGIFVEEEDRFNLNKMLSINSMYNRLLEKYL